MSMNDDQSHIMQITEGINIQDVGETGCNQKILQETREHVPWVTLNHSANQEKQAGMKVHHARIEGKPRDKYQRLTP